MLACDGLRRTLKRFLTALILYMVAKTEGDLIQTYLRPKAAQCFVNHWWPYWRGEKSFYLSITNDQQGDISCPLMSFSDWPQMLNWRF